MKNYSVYKILFPNGKLYLASTDWLVIREVDAGMPCPVEIKTLRAEARAKIVR
jgi:hypothetical protein